ncbi:MAG: LPS export ABC transporter permease LptF [Deltaproteobacteria bacterium]
MTLKEGFYKVDRVKLRTPIVFKYILTELIAPFFLGLSVFIFILVMSQVLRLNELIIVHGVGIGSVLKLVFYLLTAFLAVSIPIALLFSVLSLFGRLSADSEITALKASGFSSMQLALPVLVFAAIVSSFCLYLTIHLEAWGARSYRALVWQIGKNRATVGIKPGAFNDDFFGFVLYTDKVDPSEKTLENVFIYDDRDKTSPVSVVAKKGRLISSENLSSVFLVLYEGSLHSTKTDYSSIQKIHFESYTINLSLDEILKIDTKEKPQWLSLPRLKERIVEEEQKGDLVKVRTYKAEYHRKFSIAFANFIFAILGIALGITPARMVRSGSFAYTLFFVGAYWTVYLAGRSLAVKGILPPHLAMWFPNVLFLSFSGLLLYRTSRT